MKIKDFIEKLSEFNPDADVQVVVGSMPKGFDICWGGGGEGETKKDCKEVSFFVDGMNSSDVEEKPNKSVPLLKPQWLTEGDDPKLAKENNNE